MNFMKSVILTLKLTFETMETKMNKLIFLAVIGTLASALPALAAPTVTLNCTYGWEQNSETKIQTLRVKDVEPSVTKITENQEDFRFSVTLAEKQIYAFEMTHVPSGLLVKNSITSPREHGVVDGLSLVYPDGRKIEISCFTSMNK